MDSFPTSLRFASRDACTAASVQREVETKISVATRATSSRCLASSAADPRDLRFARPDGAGDRRSGGETAMGVVGERLGYAASVPCRFTRESTPQTTAAALADS
ncbi:unnamed protein product [Lampetra fluviatilis]